MRYDGTSKRVREVTVGLELVRSIEKFQKVLTYNLFLIKLFMIVIFKKSWMPVEVLELCYSFISNWVEESDHFVIPSNKKGILWNGTMFMWYLFDIYCQQSISKE